MENNGNVTVKPTQFDVVYIVMGSCECLASCRDRN